MRIYRPVKDLLLTAAFQDCSISRNLPNGCPPRSLDINPADYSLWDHLKQKCPFLWFLMFFYFISSSWHMLCEHFSSQIQVQILVLLVTNYKKIRFRTVGYIVVEGFSTNTSNFITSCIFFCHLGHHGGTNPGSVFLKQYLAY